MTFIIKISLHVARQMTSPIPGVELVTHSSACRLPPCVATPFCGAALVSSADTNLQFAAFEHGRSSEVFC